MTTLELTILLHYYRVPIDYNHGDLSDPATGTALARLMADGLIGIHRDYPEIATRYQISEKGRGLVESVCAVANTLQSGLSLMIDIGMDADAKLTLTMEQH